MIGAQRRRLLHNPGAIHYPGGCERSQHLDLRPDCAEAGCMMHKLQHAVTGPKSYEGE